MPNHSEHAELAALRRQYQLILNAVGEGVYGLDLEGNVTFVNPAAAAMIDWDMKELIGQSMHRVLHHSHLDGTHYHKESCPIYAALHDGSTHRVTSEVFWRKDGTNFPVEYISTPLRDEQKQVIGAVVTFRDITQRKWAEAVLQQTNEDLEEKVRSRAAELYTANEHLRELSALKSRFVSMVCHEFRNPLNNIALSVSSLGRYDEKMSQRQKQEYLSGIATNVERMTHMIDDILVLGKLEAKRLALSPQPVDLVEFCRQLLQETQPHQRQLKFIGRFKSLVAEIDQTLLRSILGNILSNSIRYSPVGSSVRLSLCQRKHHAIFQIKDQGLGILPEDYPHLFEPFHRGKNVSNIPGTGLGLSIVKQFVALQQGEIKVESEPGVGTTFKVRLPLSPRG
ncbi:PAS domain-containing sensor histidine kinase [cf. Phormidesmis sp. LEGE 11477]|uniref:PAS domain-containing sensor histidine kinase n=1 Tax=cf. Phormidesmis sp. LEGE 11477 TaxID=1828680 RepID=UPI001880142F|nr:PAS domain-containing sensor histidine kinase [cf. Phormidesmis sp. LEGE 11477]MBE9063642.1 PAS domain-containing sensor histidine kinase [cf. Phormidesmis sp. LEGE 11477]